MNSETLIRGANDLPKVNDAPPIAPETRVEKRGPGNRYCGMCACGNHAWAILTKGYVTLVSPEDAHWLQEKKWHTAHNSNPLQRVKYAKGTLDSKTVVLHRVILGNPDKPIDHKNHSGIDNRRENLRQCTNGLNQANARTKSRSGFRGVVWQKRGWQVQIGGKYLGFFASPEDAARAYDAAAIERFGEFATLNFVDSPPLVPSQTPADEPR
jgi:hypothetical protein